ncbi:MAG: hypothetical protein K9N55_07720 [Phycisphaerae bacterium]|nr:hypothetical protein [Phycisphaerae bacterium]
MDTLHFALEQEIQIEQYYRQLALVSRRKAVKEVFLKMAEVEHTHVMALQEYERSQTVCLAPAQYAECRDWVKVLEGGMPKEAVEEVMELYEAARDVKWQEAQFYNHAAEVTEIPLEKMLFNGLCKDENRGAMLIDRVCDSMFKDSPSALAIA